MATCAISGVVPEEPVVSIKTGHLFEKRLIVKHIEATGLCPVTQQPLTLEDLISVKTSGAVSKPRAPTLTTFPALLNSLQEEWDNVLLESFTLKQQVDSLKHELALALYQQDASNRVIARLMRERDESRASLVNMEANIKATKKSTPSTATTSTPTPTSGTSMSDEVESTTSTATATATTATTPTPLPEALVARLQASYTELFTARRASRKTRTSVVVPTTVLSEFSLRDTVSVSGTESGISSLLLRGSTTITGCVDGSVVLYDRATQVTLATAVDHSSSVFAISAAHDDVTGYSVVGTASSSHAILYRAAASSSTSSFTTMTKITELTPHGGAFTGIAIHPSGTLAITSSADGSWAIHDTTSGTRLRLITATRGALDCVAVHPDGQFVGLGGADGSLSLWNIIDGGFLGELQTNGAVTAIAFSENGTHAAIGTDVQASYWDLRKLTMVSALPSKGPVSAIGIDYSGTLLIDASGVEGARGVRVTTIKDWQTVANCEVEKADLASFGVGHEAKYIVCASVLPSAGNLFTFSNTDEFNRV